MPRSSEQAELGVSTNARRFQMQSHHKGVWTPMENGAAPHVWRPRSTAVDAASKCLAWTGFTGIPAMQVVDLDTGQVVWRDSHYYPDIGESIPLPTRDQQRAHQLATDAIAEPKPPPTPDLARGVQADLLDGLL